MQRPVSRNSFCQRSWEHLLQRNEFANKHFSLWSLLSQAPWAPSSVFSCEGCLFILNFTYSSRLAQSHRALWQATLSPTENCWVPRQRIKFRVSQVSPHNPLTPPLFVLNNEFQNLWFPLLSGKMLESNKRKAKVPEVLRKWVCTYVYVCVHMSVCKPVCWRGLTVLPAPLVSIAALKNVCHLGLS